MAKPYKLTTIELDLSSKSTLTMILINLLTMRQLATTKKKISSKYPSTCRPYLERPLKKNVVYQPRPLSSETLKPPKQEKEDQKF